MDKRFPRYFLMAAALYALSFLLMSSFMLVPAAVDGMAADAVFLMFLFITLLPLLILVVYMKTSLGKNHGTLFRVSFVASTLALSAVFLFVVSPLA